MRIPRRVLVYRRDEEKKEMAIIFSVQLTRAINIPVRNRGSVAKIKNSRIDLLHERGGARCVWSFLACTREQAVKHCSLMSLSEDKAAASGGTASTSTSSSRGYLYIGKYKMIKTIGKGNFARVKLARHIPTGQEVRKEREGKKDIRVLERFRGR